jgi:hypothetical protein
VFAPNHPLRQAVTALAVGNIGKQRDANAVEEDSPVNGTFATVVRSVSCMWAQAGC